MLTATMVVGPITLFYGVGWYMDLKGWGFEGKESTPDLIITGAIGSAGAGVVLIFAAAIACGLWQLAGRVINGLWRSK